jgi:hypothetical protein
MHPGDISHHLHLPEIWMNCALKGGKDALASLPMMFASTVNSPRWTFP